MKTPTPIRRSLVRNGAAMGVKTADGAALAGSRDDSAGIYLPAGARGPAFLVLPNFSVILKYNNAASYALAVGCWPTAWRAADR